MRPLPFLLAALLPALLGGAPAPALELVRPILSQMEGGAPEPPGFEYIPGQTLFFACRIANYAKSADAKIHLAYSVQPFDAKGVPLTELYKNDLADEVAAQDKEWLPKISTEIALPPLIGSGSYRVVVKVEDLVGKATAELSVPFAVRARAVEPSDTLVVRNFHFFRGEEDAQALEEAAYRSGDGLWARFDLIGFRYGPNNRIDVSYVASILGAGGKVLWSQPEPAVEQSESFYPKRYVAGAMGLSLQGTKPGSYTLQIQVKDAIGNQTCAAQQVFTVE
jgi:hypothetical protein